MFRKIILRQRPQERSIHDPFLVVNQITLHTKVHF